MLRRLADAGLALPQATAAGREAAAAGARAWLTRSASSAGTRAGSSRSRPRIRQPNLGEPAAIEVIEEPGRLGPEERGVRPCEEPAVLRRVTVRDAARIVALSTMDFLRILGAEQRTQPADAVFQRAIQQGRTPSAVALLPAHEAGVRRPITNLVRRPPDGARR